MLYLKKKITLISKKNIEIISRCIRPYYSCQLVNMAEDHSSRSGRFYRLLYVWSEYKLIRELVGFIYNSNNKP